MKFKNSNQRKAVMSKLNSNRLPIQFSIYVPSTKAHSKKLTKPEFNKRIVVTKKFMDNTFGGDTSVRSVGGYTDDGKLITEDIAIVESSTTNKAFNKKKKELNEFVKMKQKVWEQDTLGYKIEGDFYTYPKKSYIPHEAKKNNNLRI